jgi:tRNA nucleotidyltransferase (CCA-adding enzyme)
MYLKDLQGISPLLDGNDIRQLGLKPGPMIGDILRSIQRKKLDGELLQKEDEIEFVKRLINQEKEFCGSV